MIEHSGKSWFSENRRMLLFILFVIVVGILWRILTRREIDSNGVYVRAEVINTETFKSGYIATLRYLYMKQTFVKRTRSERGREQVGDLYLIKILPNNPRSLIFLEDDPVPACLKDSVNPDLGWKKIPECP